MLILTSKNRARREQGERQERNRGLSTAEVVTRDMRQANLWKRGCDVDKWGEFRSGHSWRPRGY